MLHQTETPMAKALDEFVGNLLVILVVYGKQPQRGGAWTSLVHEAALLPVPLDVFVVDNSPEQNVFPDAANIRLHYRHNSLNPGVSKAYNDGFAFSLRRKKLWLLLLDQDTFLGAGWALAYLNGVVNHPEVMLKAPVLADDGVIVSPFRYWLTKGHSETHVSPGVHSLRSYYAVNSGLLIHRTAFELADGYDETIPLDFSDFAFLARLKRKDDRIEVLNLVGTHRLSSLGKRDEDKVRQRFRQYCLGSKRMTNYTGQPMLLFALAAGRAVRLGVQYRSVKFITTLFQSWLTA